jgi:hypothetical protein
MVVNHGEVQLPVQTEKIAIARVEAEINMMLIVHGSVDSKLKFLLALFNLRAQRCFENLRPPSLLRDQIFSRRSLAS